MTFSFDSPLSTWSFKHSARVLHPQCGHSNKSSTLPNGMGTGLENKLCMLGYECNKLSSSEIEGRNSGTIFRKYVEIIIFLVIEFSIVFKFHELKSHGKVLKNFLDTRVPSKYFRKIWRWFVQKIQVHGT